MDMHVCVYIQVCVYISVCVYVCMRVSVSVYLRAYGYVWGSSFYQELTITVFQGSMRVYDCQKKIDRPMDI